MSNTIHQQFIKAYKVNLPSMFCQITAVFAISKGKWYGKHPVVLTVRKDGSDLQQDIDAELDYFRKAYDTVRLSHIL